jgi:hypothetical protein
LHFQASPFGRFSAAGPTEAVDRLPASLLQPQALAMERVAIERGWLTMNESGTYVRFTPAGADLFA